MKRSQLVSQGALARMHQASNEAWKRKDFQRFFDIVERASRMDPANFRILVELGQAYGLRQNYAAAERTLEKALRVAPDKSDVLATIAMACCEFSSSELAERYFRRAVERGDASADTLARQAALYERLNRLDEAAEAADRALERNGSCAAALLLRARLSRRGKRLEQSEQSLRSLLAVAEGDTRVSAFYELGTVLDQQGRYDEAMAAFLEAKSLLQPEAAPFLEPRRADRALIADRLTGVSADMLRRWSDTGAAFGPPRRLALLGGHPRSGTTLLEQVLDSHPDIVSSEETEVIVDDACPPLWRGFPPNTGMLAMLDAASNSLLLQARENYVRGMERFLGQPLGSRLLIGKNPPKFHLLVAYLRLFPEMKILVALRDPRDVCLSCFFQAYVPIARGGLGYLTLEDTVEGYAVLMNLWRTLAPLMKNPYLEVKYRDTVEDLESVSRKMLDFLGVPWDARVLRFNEHASQKQVRSPTYADVTKPIYRTSVGRWRNYQKYLEPHLKKLEPFVKAFGFE
jgi:tetratricopeptide (TPR) repeat protein